MRDVRELEIERNFEYFQTVLSSLLPEHYGEFALLHDKKIVGLYTHALKAMSEGYIRYADGSFSVQRVINRPLDLGFLSYGANDRTSV